MGDLKVQEAEAFFPGRVAPRYGIRVQSHTGLILKVMLSDPRHQLLEVTAAALQVLFCRRLKCLLHLTSPLSPDEVTRGSEGTAGLSSARDQSDLCFL